MENKKKTIFNVVFLLVVFVGTIYGVFHGEDLGEIVHIIKTVNPLWLIPGVVCVVVFIWGESIIIYYMMHTLGIRLKKWTCFLFSSVGFFFSCITPSATGGQPAQIYYMKKEKIPIPVSTLVLMIVTITYKLVLVVIGVALTIFGQGFIHAYLWNVRHVFYLGTALNVFCVTAMLILVFHPVLARYIMVKGLALIEKMHLMKPRRSRLEKLEASMDQYRATAVYLKEHIKVLIEVFGITVFQRFALFAATWFVYRAFGLSGTFSGGYCDPAGNDRSSSGYVAASGRHGNQRAVVPSNILTDIWKPVIASGYDLKPGTWLLYGVVYQCATYDRGELYNRKEGRRRMNDVRSI